MNKIIYSQGLVKKSGNIMNNSEISLKQIDCINYLNSIEYRINSDILKLISLEFNYLNSLIFKV
jgi:hypothetical protein